MGVSPIVLDPLLGVPAAYSRIRFWVDSPATAGPAFDGASPVVGDCGRIGGLNIRNAVLEGEGKRRSTGEGE